jgi:hypothetical protein
MGEQCLGNFAIRVASRQVEGRITCLVGSVNIGTRLNEKIHDRLTVGWGVRYPMEWRVLLTSFRTRVSPSRQQRPTGIEVACHDSRVDGLSAPFSPRIDVCAPLDQQVHTAIRTLGCSDGQDRTLQAINRSQLGTLLQCPFHVFKVATL